MKRQELCQLLQDELRHQYNTLEINNIVNYIWANLLKNSELINLSSMILSENAQIGDWISELKMGMPVQYVLNNSFFYNLELFVNTHVLIPRPETEELVNWILSDPKNESALTLIDIGTGSGCIALALKKNRPIWMVTAIDISDDALKVARKNASNNDLNVKFIQCDFLTDSTSVNETFDIVVSNPPYISNDELDKVGEGVRRYEPRIALVPTGNDPLIFYKKIADWSLTHLNRSGAIYLEMNEFLFQEIENTFRNAGFLNLEIKKDMQGKNRMLKVQF